MRITLLSQWCHPEPDVRIYPLAQELAARGHQVTIITGFPNYPQGRLYPGYRQRLWKWEQHEGFRILRLPLYPDHSQSSLKRILNYVSFALSAAILGPLVGGGADMMWVYHPPLTISLPAWWISLIRRMPFVYEIQDMWPETVVASGMMSAGLPIRLLSRLAQFVYRRADALSVISSGFKRNLVDKGVAEDKIHIIPNWADETLYHPVPRDQALGDEYGLTGHFNLMYGGNMGPAQALDIVIQAAVLVKDLPDLQFVFIGDGLSLPELKESSEKIGLTNIKFIGRQPASQMPHFFAWGDALLVQLRDDPLFHLTIPSKTLSYLACGRPILCGVPGDGAEVVRQAGAGLTCATNDPAALAETIRVFYTMPASTREAMGEAGRQAFLQNYTRQILVDQYEALFESLVQK